MKLIIVGGARCVWADFGKAYERRAHVMTVNYMALFIRQKIQHMCSMHAEGLGLMRELRHLVHRDVDIATHSCSHATGVDYVHGELGLNGGSSGCFAAAVGVKLGYDEIVLCGCPADGTGNFYDPPNLNEDFTGKRKVWKKAAAEIFDGKVRSMSGWTKGLLE